MTEQEEQDREEQQHPDAAPGDQPGPLSVDEWLEMPVSAAAEAGEEEPAPEGNALGAVGDLLANLGIKNRRAQQWVTIGGAALIFLCCSCACIIPLLSLFADS